MAQAARVLPVEDVSAPPNPTDFSQLPAVLTTAEAAAVLRVGLREVRQLVETGELPAARLGPRRVIRIRRDALLALLSGQSPARRSRRAPAAVRSAPQVGGALMTEE
jgi:excisionase family DNA binding protein